MFASSGACSPPPSLTFALGHRTVVQMRRRKFQLVLFGCLLVLLVVWILTPARRGTGDERRFRQMLHAADWGWRLRSTEKRLPGPLARLLHVANLKNRCMGKAEAQQEALLASGYLTNTSITITNMPSTATSEKSCLAELQRRLKVRARRFLVVLCADQRCRGHLPRSGSGCCADRA